VGEAASVIYIIVGGTISIIVLGAYVLSYAVLRLELRVDPSNRCQALHMRRGYDSKLRCDYEVGHDGPHHAMLDRHDRWWNDEDEPVENKLNTEFRKLLKKGESK
jgi:hypothetical protein